MTALQTAYVRSFSCRTQADAPSSRPPIKPTSSPPRMGSHSKRLGHAKPNPRIPEEAGPTTKQIRTNDVNRAAGGNALEGMKAVRSSTALVASLTASRDSFHLPWKGKDEERISEPTPNSPIPSARHSNVFPSVKREGDRRCVYARACLKLPQ